MDSLKTFLLKLLALICLVVVVDISIGLLFKNLFYKQKSGKYFTTSHALKNAGEDIVIFGNSHAAQHFNAPLMQAKSGKTVFNFGNQGQGLFYIYPTLKSMLAYHTPKLIIINLDYEELRYDEAEYQRLFVFLPYYHLNPIIDSAIAMSGKYEQVKACSAMYRYNSLLGYMLLNIYKPTFNKSMASLGYDPNEGVISPSAINESEKKSLPEQYVFDKNKIKYLINLINYIQAKHVQLMVTTAPLYRYNDSKNLYKDKLTALLNQMQVAYFNDGDDAAFRNRNDLFHDDSHLNPKGADIWTQKCLNYIQGKHLMN
ncbi:hypothetical protein [Mucilaginibacter jinjuensis]|uniref:SGNH/GDSL hydrolase family protein n=1 Tax=Mucilaginibacter jinjuensis TaxID=1176721 RepID=A0ABY7TBT2_9SPHI|nr:hypothetical protein [Mucilaginibacter jinjuensis]WCT13525.1 hypothetical protein PQO05_06195 [Mucilaginibacter jinjuensis]